MHLRAFLRQATGVGAISLVNQVVALFLGILLARWLGVDGFGVYAFVMATIVLLLIPVRFGLPNLLMRDIAASRTDPQRGTPLPLVKRAGVIVFVLGFLAAILSSVFVFFSVTNGGLRNPFLVGIWLLPVLALLDVFAYTLRALGRAVVSNGLTSLLRSIIFLTIVAALVLVWHATGYAATALSAGLAAAIVSLLIAARVTQRMLLDVSQTTTAVAPPPRAMMLAGLPFMLIGSAALVMSRTDLVMLGFLANPREVGIYRVALQGALLVSLVLNTANTIVAPEFARLYAVGDMKALEKYAVSTARVVTAVALPISVVLVVYGEALLTFLFGPEFGAGSGALSILAIGLAVSLVFGESGFMLNMTGHESATLRLYTATAILNIGLNVAMIPLLGASGAALATVTSLNVQRVLGWWIVRRRLGISTGCLII